MNLSIYKPIIIRSIITIINNMLERYFKEVFEADPIIYRKPYRIYIEYDDPYRYINNFIPFIYIHEIKDYFNMKETTIKITI